MLSAAETHHQEFEPPEALRDVIKCFWHNRREVGEQLSCFEVIPDGYAEIIFYFGILSSDVYSNVALLPSPFMMGLLNQPVNFQTRGRLEVIGIRCFPWTVFDLLGLTSGKESLHLFEHPIAGLQPALAELIKTGKIVEAINRIKQYFMDAQTGAAVDGILYKAGTTLRQTKGMLPVNEVAAAAHSTVRTLERNFKLSSGHTVKDVSALMRFEQVRNRLWWHPETNLAGLAHEMGYTDQSHLTREFKRYSRTTPAAFARKARNNKPFGDSHFVAFVQS